MKLPAAPKRPRSLMVREKRLPVLPAFEEVDASPESGEQLKPRPKTRGECAEGPRPCPWVGCRLHLYADVSPKSGTLTINFPDLEVDELLETCALDVADRGGKSLEEIGQLLNVTREAVRLVEAKAQRKLAPLLADLVKGEKRRIPRLPTDDDVEDETIEDEEQREEP